MLVVKLPNEVTTLCHTKPVCSNAICKLGVSRNKVVLYCTSNFCDREHGNRLGSGCDGRLRHSFSQKMTGILSYVKLTS